MPSIFALGKMWSGMLTLFFFTVSINAQAPADPQLTGTWSTKSNSTFTGPGFYNSKDDRLIEPWLTGISYSFTESGFYESAYYRALANPVEPKCPSAMLQWQHGTFRKFPNGSLLLTPFAVDGRQLLSAPCTMKGATYLRYNMSELFERYEIYTDPYRQITRMNMFRFDGSPLPPMYLAYTTPKMLPTKTLHSTVTPTGLSEKSNNMVKRNFFSRSRDSFKSTWELTSLRSPWLDADKWWWLGMCLTALGNVVVFCA